EWKDSHHRGRRHSWPAPSGDGAVTSTTEWTRRGEAPRQQQSPEKRRPPLGVRSDRHEDCRGAQGEHKAGLGDAMSSVKIMSCSWCLMLTKRGLSADGERFSAHGTKKSLPRFCPVQKFHIHSLPKGFFSSFLNG